MSFADYPSLELEGQIRPRRIATAAALAVATSVPWLLPIELPFGILLASVDACVFLSACWWAGLIGDRRKIVRAVWDSEGRWWLTGAKGDRWIARLDADTRVFPGILWLHWGSERGRYHMLLWLRAISTTKARRTIVRLRLQNIDFRKAAPDEPVEGCEAPGQPTAVARGS